MILKAFKYRLYPTKAQETLLEKTFGCCRYVYNKALEIKMKAYQAENKSLSIFDLTNQMVDWKKADETVWLSEVNSQALQSSLRNLDAAYTRFFKEKKGFPRFKSKHDNNKSFQNSQQTRVNFDNSRVYIPKFKGGIKAVLHRAFSGKIKTSTVSKTPSGQYYISILVETEGEIPIKPEPIESKTLGLDVGLKDFLVSSDGTKIPNPRHLNKKLKKLQRQQRSLSRRLKGSKRKEKQRRRVAATHQRVANTRKDFLHKITRQLVDNQGYTSYAIENLNVAGMLKNHKLARSIGDVGWGLFKQFLTYKADWAGKNILEIGRFEPSSRLCECGYYNKDLTLKNREWECPCCKTLNDRDLLAANNIKRFAFKRQNTNFVLREPQESTLGENVSLEASMNREARSFRAG